MPKTKMTKIPGATWGMIRSRLRKSEEEIYQKIAEVTEVTVPTVKEYFRFSEMPSHRFERLMTWMNEEPDCSQVSFQDLAVTDCTSKDFEMIPIVQNKIELARVFSELVSSYTGSDREMYMRCLARILTNNIECPEE